jgi:pilus assembly protein CpaB
MNRNRIIFGAVMAVIVGMVVSRYVYRQLQQAASVKAIPTDQVVVASARVPLGSRLQASQLKVISWPVGAEPSGSFSKVQDAVNRAVVTTVVPNEPILEEKLAPLQGGSGLPVSIPEGMRAVSVRVDEVVAVAGFTMPGTMVDVLVTGEFQNATISNSVTRAILEDIRVLAAGQQVQQDKDGKPQTVTVVTLLVDPNQANVLTMASTEGKIHLSLRNTMDSKVVNPRAVFRAALFSVPDPGAGLRRTSAMAPAKTKNPDYVVEVIRADKRETQNFPAPQREP